MAKAIMVQGTMSNSGKSFLTAGLCRVFMQDGYKVAPFKSQNMALNSYITKDGLEIGRAQAMQAEACGIEPTVDMNPILLKPTSHVGSQVIVNGEVRGNRKAMAYYREEEPRGEYVLVIEGKSLEQKRQEDIAVWQDKSIEEHMEYYRLQGMEEKAAMKQVAKDRGVSKRDIYQHLHVE